MEAPGGVEPPTNSLGKNTSGLVWPVFNRLGWGSLHTFVAFRPDSTWESVQEVYRLGERFSAQLAKAYGRGGLSV